MKVWKKLSAVTLALVMALALCVPALADDPTASASTGLTAGKAGAYTTDKKDEPNLNTKVVNIEKVITAFNPDETIIYGPAITYTYTLTPASGTELVQITDDAAVHTTGASVVKNVVGGITKDVRVNGATASTSETEASGTLVWNNELLTAATTGAVNTKTFSIDFTNVVFTAPGVYRYKITETATTSGKDYAASGVEDKYSNVRYLDVYVMRSEAYTPLTSEGETPKTAYVATDWTIYGYVCVADGTTAVGTSTPKTNGFVDTPDEYRTYNLTVKKTLSKDSSMNTHQFPFTVAFANTTKVGTFQLIAEKDTGVTVTTATANAPAEAGTTLGATDVTANSLLTIGGAAALGTFNLSIAHNNEIKFIGIPNGTTVTVTETNDVVGTTYSTSATQKVGTADASAVELTTTGSLSSDKKSASIDTDKTATYTQSTATTADTDVVIEFTNLLALISPTGVTLRYAPYLAMLGAGVVALPMSLRKKEEEI